MKILECACQYCTKETGRYPGCHDHCEKPEYLAWRKQQAEIKAIKNKEKAFNLEYHTMKSENIARTKKRVGIK